MNNSNNMLRVLVVGCGNMGGAHAKAYHEMPNVEIVGLVSKGRSKEMLNEQLGGNYPLFNDYFWALSETKPDAVCISTYPDTHEKYAIAAMESGCHVFLEKPMADTLPGAKRVMEAAERLDRKLVVGYILRFHPSWIKFVELSKGLGKPLVMRMNLNQQSEGHMWDVHRNLMKSLSPIVDCGVHYIDVMCQMTNAKPVKVSAIGARLTQDIPEDNYNYGQLQIWFDDGSVGWYEAGWGPMISENAFFIKDVIGPKGSVSIMANEASSEGNSDNVDAHTKTESILLHHADIDASNNFTKKDENINLSDEPNHQELCDREQLFFVRSILEDYDLSPLTLDAYNSFRIAVACDESIRKGMPILLEE